MTKEELEKEIKSYIDKNCKQWETDGLTVDDIVRIAVLDFAEPREKRISELERNVVYYAERAKHAELAGRDYVLKYKDLGKRCLQLQKDKGNLTDRISDLEDKLANADYQLEGRDNEIRELEAQIEKMKIKWHDLEKDPNDLPKDYKTMCICLSDFGSKYEPVPRVCVGYCDSLGWSDYMGSSLYSTVRYWCELPK